MLAQPEQRCQHRSYSARHTLNRIRLVTTGITRSVVLNVLNANGAPQFDAAETWNILEGQPLRISLFAFDPDNAGFEPKVRLRPNGPASGPDSTAPTVSYQVTNQANQPVDLGKVTGLKVKL